MKAIQVLSIFLIFSAIMSQDLLGSTVSGFPSGLPSGFPSGLNISNILPSGLNISNILPSGVLPSDFKAILEDFKKGAISQYLPKDLDLSNFNEIGSFLNDLNETNFNLNTKEIIPDMKNLTLTSKCIGKLKNVISFMSMAEQVAFYGAYQSTLKNKTAENTGRCFAPRALHKTFKTINKGIMKSMNKEMTKDSKEIRNSFSCVVKSFRQLKLQADYKPELEEFSNTQRTSNQCKGTFMRTLTQTLGSRRRYLLLSETDSDLTAILDAEGNIDGYSWLESEVETITKAFLTFANCYQALPEALTKTYANILSKVSKDPACAAPADAKRFLQDTAAAKAAAAEALKNGLPGLKDAVTDAVKNGVKDGSIKSGLPAVTDAAKDAIKNAAKDGVKNALPGLKDTVTSAAKDGVKNALPGLKDTVTSALKNGTFPSGNFSGLLPSGYSGNFSGLKPSQIFQNITGSSFKPKKQKSIGTINFEEETKSELKIISDNLNKKTGDYLTVGKMISGFITEEKLNSKCNMPGLLKGLLAEQNDKLIDVIYSEIKKNEQQVACTTDYLVLISKPRGGQDGKVNCIDADNTCADTSFTYKTPFNDSSMTMASGCISSQRYIFGYFDDQNFGKGLEFVSQKINTCEKGLSNKCAKEFANMKKSPKRILQETATCVPKMKADCNEAVSENCEESKLFENISENEPSSTDSGLPSECQNIDPLNPNYINCFTWINKNLIAYTIFPKMGDVEDLQELINKSQAAAALRYLQETSIKIVKTDASSTDVVAQIPAESYTLSASDVEIDGSTPDTITVTSDPVAEMESNDDNSASFAKIGFASIAFIIAAIIN